METRLKPVQFGDGKYSLALNLKQIIELERNCGVTDRDGKLFPKSIYAIHEELGAGLGLNDEAPVYLGGGAARPSDIRETIRLALIGGDNGLLGSGEEIKVGPAKASQLCDDYLFPHRPIVEGQYIAWAVLNAAIVGVEVKKKAVSDPESDLSPSPED
ncbi:hypothetical protein [Sphingomonas soli]|uniref:hypothetical protein n=1 Tax=Sphingomonas soli TaxID=266127 RepID=UPI00083512D5|nr:hypothetical protein [Sphingomonas soli]